MTIEFSLGRASQKSPVRIYQTLAPKGSKWFLHGYAALAGNYLLMMFYTVVAGWMIQYFFATAFRPVRRGWTPSRWSRSIRRSALTRWGWWASPSWWWCWASSSAPSACRRGLERVSKYMMLALLAIMVVLAVNSFTMDGAREGLSFYLKPDLEKMQEVGIGNVIVGAMSQAFFTLSLGMGSMAIFGSYIGKERALLGESVNVAILDTFVAVVAGLIIFPACFTYGVGGGLRAQSHFRHPAQRVQSHVHGEPVGGSLFFIFMTFAALTTVLAVFETILACCLDLFGWSRKKACLINCLLMLVLCLPCAPGLQPPLRPAPPGGRVHLHGPGRLPGEQPHPAGGLPDLPPLLREQAGLGLEELHRRGQRRQGVEGPALDAGVHDLRPPPSSSWPSSSSA